MPSAKAALKDLAKAPAQLILVGGDDAAADCRVLRDDARLGEAWLLAVTDREDSRTAVAALQAGADDYVQRPCSRTELLARTRAGVRAAQQRSDDTLLRALMVNVPGAIYRSAWHADFTLALISDEIERISGYPPANFIASAKRTLMSIVHPDDRAQILESVKHAHDTDDAFVLEYRIVRADGEIRWVLDRGQLVKGPGGRLWMDGAIFDITERREAEDALRRREVEAARTEELRASRDPHRRGRRRRAAQDRARPPRRRPAAARQPRARRARGARPARQGPGVRRPVPRPPRRRAQAGLGRAARARPRHPPRGADRARPRARDRDARRRARRCRSRSSSLPEKRLPPVVEATAYFTVSEALTNVAKYANASHATVRLANGDDSLVVEVQDDGVGGAQAGAGSGLAASPTASARSTARWSSPARPARARWCARCCRFRRAEACSTDRRCQISSAIAPLITQ